MAKVLENELILCACGYGTHLERFDSRGRPRAVLHGHQRGNPGTLVKDGSTFRGKRHSAESRAKMSAAQDRGSMGYWALHKWVARHFTKTGACEHCGERRYTEWANRDHAYNSRERANWLELCSPCHAIHDIRHNGKRQGMAARKAA